MRSKLLITILIVVLLAVYFIFGVDYIRQREGHQALTAQIIDVTETLEQLPKPPNDLERRLAVAQASLVAEQSAFPGKPNSTQVINNVLELAVDYQLKTSLETHPWTTENVGEYSYHVFRINLSVQGSFSQLVSFVRKLENDEFKSLMVENLSVTMLSKQPEGGTIPVTASLDLAVYAQSLNSE